MFGSEILDVAIGVVFVYLLLSLICSAVREIVEGWFKTRAVDLEKGIRELLHDPKGDGLTKAVYQHPQVNALFQGKYEPVTVLGRHVLASTNLPTYIPSSNFALAILDIVARGKDATDTAAASATAPALDLASVRARIATIENAPVQRALLTAIDTANGDLTKARRNIEAWYDSVMDRVSGWYKRRTQAILFGLGLALTVGANVNTITVANRLFRDKALRDAVVAEAGSASAAMHDSTGSARRLTALGALGLPIGWTGADVQLPGSSDKPTAPTLPAYIVASLLGWLLTAFAISLGAPFWFDLLNKFMIVRSTVKPKQKSPDEDSPEPSAKKAAVSAGSAS